MTIAGNAMHNAMFLLDILPIYPELCKDHEVEYERSSATDEPARIDQYVSLIHQAPLALLAQRASILLVQFRATGFICNDAHDIRQIADTCKEKEKHANAFGAFAAVIEK